MRESGTGPAYIVFLIATSVGAFLLYGPVARFLAVDSCLDLGGRWNYELGGCEGARGQNEALSVPQGPDALSVAVAVLGAIPIGLVAMAVFSLVLYARTRWFAV